jgi:hypothetical protein
MLSSSTNIKIPAAVSAVLARLRRSIRLYVAAEGVAAVVICLGFLFWIGLLVDWGLEPSVDLRVLGWIVAIAVLLLVTYRYLLRRLVAPLSNTSLALLLERSDPRLADHVATAVSLAGDYGSPDLLREEFSRRTCVAATEAVSKIQLGRLLDARAVRRAAAIALFLVVSIALFGCFAKNTTNIFLRRLALSGESWPRQVRLTVLDFTEQEDGYRIATMARHDDFELTVHADIEGRLQAPSKVQIRFQLPDGRRGQDYFTRVGSAVAGRDKHQAYRYVFKNVRDDLTFDVYGGDDRVTKLRLRVVDRPELVHVQLDCSFPEYLQRDPQSLRFVRNARIPMGAKVHVRAAASKPLREARVTSVERDYEQICSFAEVPTEEVEFDYGVLEGDDMLLIDLQDTYGVSSSEPYRLSVSVVADEVPQVSVHLEGIGSAITPAAQIPVAGLVTDDYGLQDVWFEYSLDGGSEHAQPFVGDVQQKTVIEVAERLDVRDGLAAADGDRVVPVTGQKLTIGVVARDRCDIGSEPREGRSQEFQLDIVSPADLLLRIERRELAYRQRFEAIYDKVADTRGLLARIEFREEPVAEEETPSADSQREETLRRLRLAGSRQNVTQAADEVLNVAEGFSHLHDQLVNNRIDDSELKHRLKLEIADPLREISQEKMPPLELQLDFVIANLASHDEAATSLGQAIGMTDEILADMQYVLERMRELETYNEVVALLRGIMSEQDRLNDQTKKLRKIDLRSLLKE